MKNVKVDLSRGIEEVTAKLDGEFKIDITNQARDAMKLRENRDGSYTLLYYDLSFIISAEDADSFQFHGVKVV